MVDENEVREVEMPEQGERLAEVRQEIAEAKADAADLRDTNPDPFPESEPPEEDGTPAN
ncbi:hypothetical protein [Saccharothrix syringae]|uniref:hypothetical protein n=1 Tax=Saccharothrix syringae TaxID=103733 RepID=UPI001293A0E8|nr:hypothetical protein [Saccharothrix syringae]